MENNGVLKNLENDKGLYATKKRWRIDPWLYGDIRNLHLSYYIFYVLFRFLMISKGSWVALATCSVESPIASKRCAVSGV